MATCEELATMMASNQANLVAANASLNSTNLSIAAANLSILGNDPGAIVPLNAANVAIRITQLSMQMPANYPLLAQYTALAGLWALYAAVTAQIGFIELAIVGIQQQQAAQNC